MMASPTLFELQVHPAGGRRRVRSYRLTRRQVVRWKVAAVVVGLVLVTGLALFPRALGRWLRSTTSDALDASRDRQLTHERAVVAALEELAARSAALRLRLGKISRLYELDWASSPPPGLLGAEAPLDQRGDRAVRAIEGDLASAESALTAVAGWEAGHAADIRLFPVRSPLAGGESVLISPFGERENPFNHERDFHPGLDLAAPAGTLVRAPADGVVAYVGQFTADQSAALWRYGNVVVLNHGGRFLSLFGHCREVTSKLGQRVRQGDPLATVGSTGVASSPHLHFEVRRLGDDGRFRPVDPRFFLLGSIWPGDEQRLAEGVVSASVFESIPGVGR